MLNAQFKSKYQLAEQLGQALAEKQATVCTVESCTGGGIAFAITDVPGSSAWINQSWVTYSNEAKTSLVGVLPDTLAQVGAVSEGVVIQMAEGARARSKADYAVSVSGIAGPAGGSKDKPVGLVWFAISTETDTYTFSRCFSGDRQQVREQAIILSLEKLISCVVQSQ
jgi:nicotinamide-nucleotide amidase